jgi:hypothetical protein
VYRINFLVSVGWASAKAIECALQQPVFVIFGIWITDWWFDDGYFIVRENILAKCIFAISLAQCAAFLDCHTGQKAHAVWTKHQCILVRFEPHSIFIIPKNYNTCFSLKGI